MKTRIVSAVIMILLVTVVLLVGYLLYPLAAAIFVALLAAFGTYEMLHSAFKINVIAPVICGMVYAALAVLVSAGFLPGSPLYAVTYALITVAFSLFMQKRFALQDVAALLAMPFVLGFAFSSLYHIALNGLFYLLVLCNCACMCDTGAYFVGSAIGKHKLCPEISPKKTVEGAVGGLALTLITGVILFIIFSGKNIFIYLALTLLLGVVGMCGDLFASVIKRYAGIKDYSNLIPGHGGILDRTDSILLISVVFSALVKSGLAL